MEQQTLSYLVLPLIVFLIRLKQLVCLKLIILSFKLIIWPARVTLAINLGEKVSRLISRYFPDTGYSVEHTST